MDSQNNKYTILKVLVGSRAHGLHNSDSDYDYRGVYVIPTSEILSVGYKPESTTWIEGNIDDTAYEIGHFLMLALKCNPSVLEVLKSDTLIESNEFGDKLLKLFPYLWEPKLAYDAFTGYAHNQRKKLLENKDNRPYKFAVAYLRTLYNLCDLLKTGNFSLRIIDDSFLNTLLQIKKGVWSTGEIIDEANKLTALATHALNNCEPKTQNIGLINEFLLQVREYYW